MIEDIHALSLRRARAARIVLCVWLPATAKWREHQPFPEPGTTNNLLPEEWLLLHSHHYDTAANLMVPVDAD